jgi:hypothetical protein
VSNGSYTTFGSAKASFSGSYSVKPPSLKTRLPMAPYLTFLSPSAFAMTLALALEFMSDRRGASKACVGQVRDAEMKHKGLDWDGDTFAISRGLKPTGRPSLHHP